LTRFDDDVSGCEFGDKATWCSTTLTDGSQCYDAKKADTCCSTCGHLRSYGLPGSSHCSIINNNDDDDDADDDVSSMFVFVPVYFRCGSII